MAKKTKYFIVQKIIEVVCMYVCIASFFYFFIALPYPIKFIIDLYISYHQDRKALTQYQKSPAKQARLRHIFEHQVYGLAPTEIIYRIATAYILGFDRTVSITKHNLRQWDALKSIKNDTLEKDLAKLFPEMKSVKQACIVRHD